MKLFWWRHIQGRVLLPWIELYQGRWWWNTSNGRWSVRVKKGWLWRDIHRGPRFAQISTSCRCCSVASSVKVFVTLLACILQRYRSAMMPTILLIIWGQSWIRCCNNSLSIHISLFLSSTVSPVVFAALRRGRARLGISRKDSLQILIFELVVHVAFDEEATSALGGIRG